MAERRRIRLPRSGFVHLASIPNQTIFQISDSKQNTSVLSGARLAVFEGFLYIQDTLPPGNSSDTFGTSRASISPEFVDEAHIRTGVVNFGLVEMLK